MVRKVKKNVLDHHDNRVSFLDATAAPSNLTKVLKTGTVKVLVSCKGHLDPT